jgi:hypothetical protein
MGRERDNTGSGQSISIHCVEQGWLLIRQPRGRNERTRLRSVLPKAKIEIHLESVYLEHSELSVYQWKMCIIGRWADDATWLTTRRALPWRSNTRY